MAITRVQSKSGATSVAAASLTVTFDAVPTAGNTVVAAVVCNASLNLRLGLTVADFVLLPRVGANAVDCILAFGRVKASPPDGAIIINVESAVSSNMAMVVAEYTGIFAPDRGVSAVGSSTSAASGASDNTAIANELWVGCIGARGTNANTISAPTNSFSIVAQTNTTTGTTNADRTVALLERIVAAIGTVNVGGTLTTNNWAAIGLALQPFSATKSRVFAA